MKKYFSILFSLLFIFPLLTGCGGGSSSSSTTCPSSKKINIVSSINNWGILAKEIGGDCVDVKNIISSTSVEPHDYEPTVTDIQSLNHADIVIKNGLGYDSWVKTTKTVIDVAKVVEAKSNANPHLWTNVEYISKAFNEIATKMLDIAVAGEKDYLDKRIDEKNKLYEKLKTDLYNYNDPKVKYIATESAFDYFFSDSENLGFTNKTPKAYQNAVQNESEPSISAFNSLMSSIKNVNLLIVNTQEESNITKKIIDEAQKQEIKIVEITEQVPENFDSLYDWLYQIFDEVKYTKAN